MIFKTIKNKEILGFNAGPYAKVAWDCTPVTEILDLTKHDIQEAK